MPGLTTTAESDSPSRTAAPATVVSTVTVRGPAATAQSQPPQDVHKFSTIMPAVLIAFVVFLSIFLACGLMHARRRRMQRAALQHSLEAAQRKPRKKRHGAKPQLWDVEVGGICWDDEDLEALLPVAAQVDRESSTSEKPQGKPPGLQQPVRKPWFSSHAHRPHTPEPPTQQAQVAFILSMPSQNRQAGHSSEDSIVLGTTTVPYRSVDEDDDYDGFVHVGMLSEKAML